MVPRTKLQRRFILNRTRNSPGTSCRMEPLEGRTLLSAWSTVDSLPMSNVGVAGMTADKAGNVYAVGDILDSNGKYDSVIREKVAGSASWTTLYGFGASVTSLKGIGVDAKGDVFVTGGGWTVWELAQGASSPVVIDSASGAALAVAVDAGGNLYAAGFVSAAAKGNLSQRQWAVRRGTFNSASGSWSFSTVDQIAAASQAQGVAVVTTPVASGIPSTAVYIGGLVGSSWVVRKSVNGGSWSQVDSFRYDSGGAAASVAWGVAADLSGNLYVAGYGQKATIAGYTKNHTPTYTYANHWLVRKSSNGGATWNTDDDVYPGSPGASDAYAICVDPQTGAMDVAGYLNDSAGLAHGIVRSNAGGSWATVGDYTGPTMTGAFYDGIASDPAGNLYAGGESDLSDFSSVWLIRSLPAAPTNLTASPDAVLPSSQIDLSWTNVAGADATGFAVYRSTDGVNFTLLGTVGGTVTSYTDGGVAAGTTYYYYVLTLLNSDGASAPSATVTATTSA